MKNVLVTGANRGIGLEFVRQLASGFKEETKFVFATCRDPANAKELQAVKDSSKVNVEIIKLDVSKEEDVNGMVATVRKVLGPSQGLNLLINNAGYAPSFALDQENHRETDKIFSTNVTGPFMVMKALLPLLRLSADQSSEKGMSCSKSAVVSISSGLGSSNFTVPSGQEGQRVLALRTYCASKAALNQLMRFMAAETKDWGILVFLLNPGWVQTAMGTAAADLTPEQSVGDMLVTIASRTEEHHGLFFDRKGNTVNF